MSSRETRARRGVAGYVAFVLCAIGIATPATAIESPATARIISTVAGGGDGGLAIDAALGFPTGVAFDRAGNLYESDASNNQIRRIDEHGIITVLAGCSVDGLLGEGVPARSAAVTATAVATDDEGNVYLADTFTNRVRIVDRRGVISTIAGTVEPGFSGDGGPARFAMLAKPAGVAVAPDGRIAVADTDNNRVRLIDQRGIIMTVAGSGVPGFSGDGGAATAATLFGPQGVAFDAAGRLLIADTYNNRIRRVDAAGTISTVAGGGEPGHLGDGGPARQATLNQPQSVVEDRTGALDIADTWNYRIRRVDRLGRITTIAGTGERGFSGDGGPASAAQFSSPMAVAIGAAGELVVADGYNNRLRRVDRNGTITTIAGNGTQRYSGDGHAASSAMLDSPSGLAWSAGNIYIADAFNQRVRRVDAAGVITTVAGTGVEGAVGDGGPATEAELSWPRGLAVDRGGRLFVADAHRVRMIDAHGVISTVAGGGTADPGDGGLAVDAAIEPKAVAVDGQGNLLVAEGNRIRRVDHRGIITTLAGSRQSGFSGDELLGTQAQLASPSGIAADTAGNVYVADTGNRRIRKIDRRGIITTIAGTGGAGFAGDGGRAVAANVDSPYGVAVAPDGAILAADSWNNRIRRIDTAGIITTVAGSGDYGFNGDGIVATLATLDSPRAIATDAAGSLLVADLYNNRVRLLMAGTTTAGTMAASSAGDGLPLPDRTGKIDGRGVIRTVAGTGAEGFSGDGGPATAAALNMPTGLTVGPAGTGDVYIAEYGNQRVRRVDGRGRITTFAGTGVMGYAGDGGRAADASLNAPSGVARSDAGDLYIADARNARVRKVDRRGIITTVAGNGEMGYAGDGGPAVDAELSWPTSVAVDRTGILYIADSWWVRRVDPAGVITTVAGNGGVTTVYGAPCLSGIPATLVALSPTGLSIAPDGAVVVADSRTNCVRRIGAGGLLEVVAGNGHAAFSGDGGPATAATLRGPTGVAYDAAGNLYVADAGNERIRRIDPNGVITTVAGSGRGGYSGDGGPATAAALNGPTALAVSGNGHLLIADTGNHRIRSVALGH